MKTDFKKVTVAEILSDMNKKYKSWSTDRLLKLLDQIKILNHNVFDLKKYYPDVTIEELVY